MESARQVTVKLSTQLPAALRVPATALAVPAELTRYGLSEVVNSMLSLGAHCRRMPDAVRSRARAGREAAALTWVHAPRASRAALAAAQRSPSRSTFSSTTSCWSPRWRPSSCSAASARCGRAARAGGAAGGADLSSAPPPPPLRASRAQESILKVEYIPALGPLTPEVRGCGAAALRRSRAFAFADGRRGRPRARRRTGWLRSAAPGRRRCSAAATTAWRGFGARTGRWRLSCAATPAASPPAP